MSKYTCLQAKKRQKIQFFNKSFCTFCQWRWRAVAGLSAVQPPRRTNSSCALLWWHEWQPQTSSWWRSFWCKACRSLSCLACSLRPSYLQNPGWGKWSLSLSAWLIGFYSWTVTSVLQKMEKNACLFRFHSWDMELLASLPVFGEICLQW